MLRPCFSRASLLNKPENNSLCKGKGCQPCHTPRVERRRGIHLPFIGIQLVRGQCDAGPTVTFPVAERRRPVTGTKLYRSVTGTQRCEQLAQSLRSRGPTGSRTDDLSVSILKSADAQPVAEPPNPRHRTTVIRAATTVCYFFEFSKLTGTLCS